MTLEATETMFNGFLRSVVVFVGWAIAIYAVVYFAVKFWRWLGLPNLLSLLPERTSPHNTQREQEAIIKPVHDTPVSPLPETSENPFPSVSPAGKSPGNALSVSPSLAEANAYAEMVLIDRLADMVLAEKLDKSVAIKLGMRAPTGRAYQAAKEKLETVMRSKEFPTLTKDGRPIARQLRTSAK